VPLYETGVGMGYIDYAKQLFTETSAFTRECLSLPIYPELEDYEVEQIVGIVKQYYIDQT
jgi:dTDP-4-amino-4,6-dideoxygalactose transaminase